MCGIAGFINARVEADGAVLQGMLARIAHRGPDGQGVFVQGRAALGHRRLAIIDLDGGPQPMFNEDGRLAVVFNGEIYNYQALTEELTAAGHTFATKSDTEVLLHGWEEWGRDLLPRLRGMFAFALWDRESETLFCARDYFGIKPLYYYEAEDGTLLFASEIKAFLDHPAFEKQLNESQLELYLSFQYSPGEDTFFRGVKKLLPAHCLTLDGSGLRVERWWQADFTPELSPTDWPQTIDETMQDSVAAHKIADVEVAGFLSGGVDSAYITSLARPTRCYTIGYAEEGYDEAAEAAHLARVLGIQNRVRRITPEEFWDAIPAVQYHMDEPLADAAAVALYFLNSEAARDVKVCLSGEGADEFFAGYNIYKEPFTASWYDRLPAGLRRALGAVAQRLPAVPGVNFLVRRALPLEERYYGNTALMTERQKRRLLRHDYRATLPFDLARPYWQASAGLDPVTRMQWCDLHLWLAGDILLKADKMSMAHSLELRVPYLDREVLREASSYPVNYKIAGDTKAVLRAAANKTLPDAWANRTKKGFPVPIAKWLEDPAFAAKVRARFESDVAAEYFDQDKLVAMLADPRHERRKIWTAYTFLTWHEQFFEKWN